MEWYYHRQGIQHGPITKEELKDLIRSGRLSPEDLVWNQEMGDQWSCVSSVASLHGGGPPPLGSSIPTDGTTPNSELMARARASLKGNWGLAILALLILGTAYQLPNIVRFLIDPSAFTHHPAVKHPVGLAGLWKPLAGMLVVFASFLFTGPLTVGMKRFFLNLARQTSPAISDLFIGFRKGGSYYWRTVGLLFLIGLLMLGWMLASIVPAGVVIAGLLWVTKTHPQFHLLLILVPAIAAFIFLIIKAYSYSMAYYVIADHPSLTAREAIRRSVRMMKGRIWKLVCLGFRFLGWALLSILTCGIGFLWVGAYAGTSMAHFFDDVKGRADNPEKSV